MSKFHRERKVYSSRSLLERRSDTKVGLLKQIGLRPSIQLPNQRDTDVITQIKKIVEQFDARLTIDERNLISVAYKNLTNTLRNSWRTVDTVEKLQASRAPATTKQLRLIRRQREKIERELTTTCKDIVGLLDKQLLPATKPGEERVFYLKMSVVSYRFEWQHSQLTAGKETTIDIWRNLPRSRTENDTRRNR